MNLEDILKNMNPQMLSSALGKMSNVLSADQMKQVENAIKSADKGSLNQKLNNLNASDLQKELQNNPALAKALASNPELVSKLNNIFKK